MLFVCLIQVGNLFNTLIDAFCYVVNPDPLFLNDTRYVNQLNTSTP